MNRFVVIQTALIKQIATTGTELLNFSFREASLNEWFIETFIDIYPDLHIEMIYITSCSFLNSSEQYYTIKLNIE
jgi:hypothetical protein